MGLLTDILSRTDAVKRRLGGLLSDPASEAQRLIGNDAEFGAAPSLPYQTQQAMGYTGSVFPGVRQYGMGLLNQQRREQIDPAAMQIALNAITAYHGSPYTFDKFDASKIGTGEGKQQQGYGIYLSQRKDIAQKYADKESLKRGMDAGHVYSVDMPNDVVANMAVNELPISEQPAVVKRAITNVVTDQAHNVLQKYYGWADVEDAPFAAVLQSLESVDRPAAVSAALAREGVSGIRYLDQGSRSAGQGTYNYILFDPALAKILGRE